MSDAHAPRLKKIAALTISALLISTASGPIPAALAMSAAVAAKAKTTVNVPRVSLRLGPNKYGVKRVVTRARSSYRPAHRPVPEPNSGRRQGQKTLYSDAIWPSPTVSSGLPIVPDWVTLFGVDGLHMGNSR